MHIQITKPAVDYIRSRGMDSIAIRAIPRRSCCIVDYTSFVRLGPPDDPRGYERIRVDDISVYVSNFITGFEKENTRTVKLIDLKVKKTLVMDRNE